MQVCPQCTHELGSAIDLEAGVVRRCPHCGVDVQHAAVHTELLDLPVPLRAPSPHLRMHEESLPVPLRAAPDYRLERPKSSPPRQPQPRPVSLSVVAGEPAADALIERLMPPPGVPTLSVGPISNPPPTAAQITLPDQAGPKTSSPSLPTISAPQLKLDISERSQAERSTTDAKPIVLAMERGEPASAQAAPTDSAPQVGVDPPSPPASQPPVSASDSAQLAKLSVRAGSTQSAKPISLAARSPTPSSQNSAGSQPGEMPLSAMFSLAASRQSLTSQTPQALKLGWLISGLALAALLLLLTILVLIERGRPDPPAPLVPQAGSMQ